MNKAFNHDFWMRLVDQYAEASTCRVKIGCVIIRSNSILGMGYVGAVHGDDHCNIDDRGCLLLDNFGLKGSSENSTKSCEATIHGEANAVLNCMTRGNLKDGWLTSYSTYSPCLNCLKLMLQIGIRTFIFKKDYKDVYRIKYIQSLSKQIKNDFIWVSHEKTKNSME